MKCPAEEHGQTGCSGEVKERRLNTAYHYDEVMEKAGEKDRNIMFSCQSCYDEAFAYYKDLWEEYYRGLL